MYGWNTVFVLCVRTACKCCRTRAWLSMLGRTFKPGVLRADVWVQGLFKHWVEDGWIFCKTSAKKIGIISDILIRPAVTAVRNVCEGKYSLLQNRRYTIKLQSVIKKKRNEARCRAVFKYVLWKLFLKQAWWHRAAQTLGVLTVV